MKAPGERSDEEDAAAQYQRHLDSGSNKYQLEMAGIFDPNDSTSPFVCGLSHGITCIKIAIRDKKPKQVANLISRISKKTVGGAIRASDYQQLIKLAMKTEDLHMLRAVLHPDILLRLEKKVYPLHMLADCEMDNALLIDEFRQGLDTRLVDADGNSLLHLAIERGHKHIVGKIVHESDLNCKNKRGLKPIELAALLGKFSIVKALYAAGGDVFSCIALIETKLNSARMYRDSEKINLYEDLLKKMKSLPGIECGKKLDSSVFPANDQSSEIFNLAFKGGSVKGLAYLAAIIEAIKLKLFKLENINGFAGTSAGAITAALLALRIPLEKLEAIMKKQDFFDFLDFHNADTKKLVEKLMSEFGDGLDGVSIRKVLSNYYTINSTKAVLDSKLGLCKGEALYAWLRTRFAEGLAGSDLSHIAPENITFKDLAESKYFHANLIMYGFNVNTGFLETYSAETTPDMCVLDAIRCSMSIPFVFAPHQKYIVKNGKRQLAEKTIIVDGVEKTVPDTDFIVDGGVVKNYPIRAFDHVSRKENTLGFAVVDPDDHNKLEHGKIRQGVEIKKDSIINFTLRLMQTIMFNQQNQDLEDGLDIDRTVFINVHDVGMLEFKLLPHRQELLYAEGVKGVHHFMRRKQNLPAKRLSLEVVKILFAAGLINDNGIMSLDGVKTLTAVDIFKIYACAKDEELAFLKTIVNPNCVERIVEDGVEKGRVTALQIALAYGYADVAKRLINCNANSDVDRMSPEQIEQLIDLHDVVKSGGEDSSRILVAEHREESEDSVVSVAKLHEQLARLQAELNAKEDMIRQKDDELREKTKGIDELAQQNATLSSQLTVQMQQLELLSNSIDPNQMELVPNPRNLGKIQVAGDSPVFARVNAPAVTHQQATLPASAPSFL